jgi:hypothetical protein
MANVMTPKFRASYPHLFKANRNQLSGKDEYSVVALFKKGDDLSALKKAAEAILIEELGPDKAKWPKKLKTPFRDQSEREKDGVLPAGHEEGAIFLNLKSTYKPGVVDQNVQPIIDDKELYAGCWCRATVRPYFYNQAGNVGVAFGLQNVQKVADGEPLGGGRANPENEFAPVETSSDDMWT